MPLSRAVRTAVSNPAIVATLWAAAAFALWFWYAQFVPMMAWNSMELIIANHLLDHGTYVTSLDYPTALTWRPVVPTLVVTAVRVFTDDPIRIYQWVCGLSLGVATASMFQTARRLWGLPAAHLAALLTVGCPAITTYLINHVLSCSHVVTLMFLGPALVVATELTLRAFDGRRISRGLVVGSGLLWGLCALCRSELLLFAVIHAVVQLWLVRRDWRRVVRVAVGCGAFAAVFVPVDCYIAHVADRDGILIRKTIYRMYLSQVWVDAPPLVGTDLEPQGYAYAVKLYGTPEENGESMIRAIRRNPEAFERRVRINLSVFYRWMRDPTFLAAGWGIGAVLVVLAAPTRLIARGARWVIVTLLGMFAATHFILLFHIDPRYLTIAMPTVILLLAGLGGLLAEAMVRRRWWMRGLAGVGLAAGIALVAVDTWNRVSAHGPRNDTGPDSMRVLAAHFRAAVPHPILGANREPHIGFVFPDDPVIRWEDSFLLGYFTRTAWAFHWGENVMPTGRFYSWRKCEDDYLYVPASKFTDSSHPGWARIGETTVPALGPYVLLARRTSPVTSPPPAGSGAGS